MPRSRATTVVLALALRLHRVRLGDGHVTHEVGALHLGRLQHLGQERVSVKRLRGDAHAHRSALAEVAGQGAGVDVTDAHDRLGTQFVVE